MYQIHLLFLKRLFFVVVLLIVFGLKNYAQTSSKIDSLKTAVRQANGINRFEAFYELGLQYYYQK